MSMRPLHRRPEAFMRALSALSLPLALAGLLAPGCGTQNVSLPGGPCDSQVLCSLGLECRDGTCQLPSRDSADASLPPDRDASVAPDASGPGGPDASEPGYCGDGQLDDGEGCDDHNSVPGDGCSGVCQIEPGSSCPVPGESCVDDPSEVCGDGLIQGGEACDDHNVSDDDGCSAGCEVEPDWSCQVPGQACEPAVQPACGDGTVNSGEQCDDHDTDPGDGCGATCQLEGGWTCPTPGQPCQRLEYCGDGVVQPARGEQCDDHGSVPGDGCSGLCLIDPGYACPTPGAACVKVWVCGNGRVDPGEACDDGNAAALDGCSADCIQVEPGYTCPKGADGTGGACVVQPTNTCGDGRLGGLEQCDDGNTTAADGCSATCWVEAGYTCPTAGQACTAIGYCGDGKRDLVLGEDCDDKNTASGDGCTSLCKIEPNYVCPTPGAPCVSTVKCNDGKVTGSETCDDGNALSNDGCSSTCQVEAGWQCPAAGARCVAKRCGDGLLAGNEGCDDGNVVDNDGCSAACKLRSKTTVTNPSTTGQPSTQVQHYTCAYPTPMPVPPRQTCTPTVCGDGVRQGTEQCDDGNQAPLDGCSSQCLLEPGCPNGACVARCGDGILFDFDGNGDGAPDEACEDGNVSSGDGCSSTCQLETGFTCQKVVQAPPGFLDIPVIFRDFQFWDAGAAAPNATHPDFERYTCSNASTGLVQRTLTNRVPVFATGASNQGCGTQLTSANDFKDWYRDIAVNTVRRSKRIDTVQLRLTRQGTAGNYSYVFDSANDEPYKTKSGFLPIDNLGWGGNQGTGVDGLPHNFAFTTEFRYWFTYDATQSPQLDFSGDDDFWVFVNNQLALDLGGLHPSRTGSFTLDPATASALGLVDKHVYELAAFHAERHTKGSNFKLTLRDFVKATSSCAPVCGDGKVLGDEVCDDGVNDGRYGGCMAGCRTRAPYCGDALPGTGEECDDGTNAVTYGGTQRACGPNCKWAHYCGDEVVSNGEQCDEGTANGSGYDHCTVACQLGPRCGDGLLDAPQEQCDDGAANGTSGDRCDASCQLKCGNGFVDPGELCDDGTAQNVGGYGKCSPDCSLFPYCGDGVQNGAEKCDDGLNDGSYGTCKPDCGFANYCGDGVRDATHEACDLGASNSASAYGDAKCSNRCTAAPRCGDQAVDGVFGEVCDDGVNSGQPGSCTADCEGFVPLESCGNGVVDAPEQCDAGASNGAAGSACDAHCRFRCGNGVKESGEQCDNGKNDGAYGSCDPDCTLADYCGDAFKNGPESCDSGASNVPVPEAYGAGVCTAACSFAPYCGDGRVQTQFGEQCDGSAICRVDCKLRGPN